MIRFKIRVVSVGGATAEATAGPPDLIAFERAYERSVIKLQSEMKFEDLAYLAWHALKRAGQVSADFDAWLDDLADLELVDAGEVPPLGGTASTG